MSVISSDKLAIDVFEEKFPIWFKTVQEFVRFDDPCTALLLAKKMFGSDPDMNQFFDVAHAKVQGVNPLDKAKFAMSLFEAKRAIEKAHGVEMKSLVLG